MIAIVDYEMGNLRSVQKAINRLGHNCIISREEKILNDAEKIILPGVGNFKVGMENLKKFGLIDLLNNLVITKKIPVLGICLGMQLMTSYSEEGECQGLNWVRAKTLRFAIDGFKVPHIGWNSIDIRKNQSLFSEISSLDEFYFVHSYYVKCEISSDILFTSNYGIIFDSGFLIDNIIGVQFHPEKSHNSGLKVLNAFLNK